MRAQLTAVMAVSQAADLSSGAATGDPRLPAAGNDFYVVQTSRIEHLARRAGR